MPVQITAVPETVTTLGGVCAAFESSMSAATNSAEPAAGAPPQPRLELDVPARLEAHVAVDLHEQLLARPQAAGQVPRIRRSLRRAVVQPQLAHLRRKPRAQACRRVRGRLERLLGALLRAQLGHGVHRDPAAALVALLLRQRRDDALHVVDGLVDSLEGARDLVSGVPEELPHHANAQPLRVSRLGEEVAQRVLPLGVAVAHHRHKDALGQVASCPRRRAGWRRGA